LLDPLIKKIRKDILVARFTQKPVPVHGDSIRRVEVLLHVTEMKRIHYIITDKLFEQVEKSFPEETPGRIAFLENRYDFVFQFPVQLGDEDILALEITVDRSGGHARLFGDLGHRGAVETLFGNELKGRLHNIKTLV
jgi:hypothetical protein